MRGWGGERGVGKGEVEEYIFKKFREKKRGKQEGMVLRKS